MAFYTIEPSHEEVICAYLKQMTMHIDSINGGKPRKRLRDYDISFGPKEVMDDKEMRNARKSFQKQNSKLFVRKKRKKRKD